MMVVKSEEEEEQKQQKKIPLMCLISISTHAILGIFVS